MMRGERVPPLKDIPLEGPTHQTITPPRNRRPGFLVFSLVVLLVVLGLTVMVVANPSTLGVMARAFGAQ